MDWETWVQIMLLMFWGAVLGNWTIHTIKAPTRFPKEWTNDKAR